jgi:hypothetical protein
MVHALLERHGSGPLLERHGSDALLERRGSGALWCIPFVHLGAFYRSFGFADRAPPWPAPIAAKVADCIALKLPEVLVLVR